MMHEVRVQLADPEFRSAGCALRFTLTYEGELQIYDVQFPAGLAQL